ncbi:hypothetical protein A8L34_05070 [Bacillus sp. FJAT-27264]|uniref:SIR2 family protein n=1 Tax=Paenibacillus sp. (strain DSM 101736 / FJAT-27264) TaxID=1850362 RepID=UPI00080804F0|nr:SIR2 family protein [Bacillus sp. FJAT-27264]OBZ18922.1 hypothetical protein A8L34_05070 [Bacillus sp. FJAT-27264]
MLNKMSVIKNYFDTDLYNIEEVLSILEMNDYLNGNNNTDKFNTFLKDVIEHYTPIPKAINNPHGIWTDSIFGGGDTKYYGNFVAELFNLCIQKYSNSNDIYFKPSEKPVFQYSIISLNYDLVLESAFNFLNNNYDNMKTINFNKNLKNKQNSVRLSKLHGCIEMGNIVPPTWNKNSNTQLVDTWKGAQKQLSEANHIRILGYSLPLSDSYMKYMFKSSILESAHLKSIDVIALDPNGEVQKRYDDFIDFKHYSFRDRDIKDYLMYLNPKPISNTEHIFNKLEEVHGFFMK